MSTIFRIVTRIQDMDDFNSSPGGGTSGYVAYWNNSNSAFELSANLAIGSNVETNSALQVNGGNQFRVMNAAGTQGVKIYDDGSVNVLPYTGTSHSIYFTNWSVVIFNGVVAFSSQTTLNKLVDFDYTMGTSSADPAVDAPDGWLYFLKSGSPVYVPYYT